MKRLSLVIIALVFPFLAAAEDPAIFLSSAYLFTPEPVFVVKIGMNIQEPGGQKTREVELSVEKQGDRSFSLSRVTRPAFLSDMKFLKRSENEKVDSIWVKTSRGVRRIGDGNRNESVFGSHFTVEDFGSIDGKGFDLSFNKSLDTNSERAIVAKPLSPATYALRVIWVENDNGLVTRMEYRDASGKILRRYLVTKTTGSGKAMRPLEARMEDLVNGGSTTISLLSFSTPASLPEHLFSPGTL
ncbi:MAG TPA: outer membrane lipoprotein-sorting protein [Rectinemataceae bacterium]|nr:outer membrane lipoprotein-sorting protein [Rectinemataceae bacterium]